MKYILTAEEMKLADKRTMEYYGMPSAVLMERAALAIRDEVLTYLETECHAASQLKSKALLHLRPQVLVLCGSGNNGGDGFAAARLLLVEGIVADVWFLGDESRMTAECRRQKEIFTAYGGRIYNRNPEREYSIIIDAVFGVGLKRDVTGSYAEAIELANYMHAYRIAADIPSGISADSGEILGTAFQADLTVTFGFLKRGLCLYPGKRAAGKIVLDSVGITEHSLWTEDESDPASEDVSLVKNDYMKMLEEKDISILLPKRQRESHKGSYGKVLVIAGSEAMSGAAFLSAKAAYTCGAGLVKIYTHQANRSVLAELLPEALITCYDSFRINEVQEQIDWADVVVIGPGLSKCKISVNLVKETLCHCTKTCIIDADAVNILSEHPEYAEGRRCKTILTPHMMEMSRLTGESIRRIAEHRIESLETVLGAFADVCVLKDAVTITGDITGTIYINQTGNSSLSKGGSGDILTGIIAGLLSQGMALSDAAALAVYLHGYAGEKVSRQKGYYSVLASDLLTGLTELLREFGDER